VLVFLGVREDSLAGYYTKVPDVNTHIYEFVRGLPKDALVPDGQTR
jgi:hypothetical protein